MPPLSTASHQPTSPIRPQTHSRTKACAALKARRFRSAVPVCVRRLSHAFLPPLQAVTEDEGPFIESEDVIVDEDDMKAKGALWDGFIQRYNQGGVIVKVGPIRGFCPYSKMDPTRLANIIIDRTEPIDGSSLLKQPIKCLVQEIDDQGRPILSEKAYLTSKALDFYKPGDIVKGKVSGIQSYGVFLSVPSEDGEYHGVFGFVHVSELSWDVVTRPETVVQLGDEVEAFVKDVKRYSNQLELSLRHEYLDPLKESISSLLPLNGELYQNMTWEQPEAILPELDSIMETLKLEPGIQEVQPARQAEVQHKVSLDLELWLSKEEVEDGFNLVAWSGRTLQEIHVQTDLTRDAMKDTLRGVLKRAM